MSTCMDSCMNFTYMFTNIISEIGEFSGKIAKAKRQKKLEIRDDELVVFRFQEDELNTFLHGLKMEWFDVLWQWMGMCEYMGWDPEELLQMGLQKLAKRKAENKIDGEGDDR